MQETTFDRIMVFLYDLSIAVCNTLMILYTLWVVWHGISIQTGGVEIDFNGISRFFR